MIMGAGFIRSAGSLSFGFGGGTEGPRPRSFLWRSFSFGKSLMSRIFGLMVSFVSSICPNCFLPLLLPAADFSFSFFIPMCLPPPDVGPGFSALPPCSDEVAAAAAPAPTVCFISPPAAARSACASFCPCLELLLATPFPFAPWPRSRSGPVTATPAPCNKTSSALLLDDEGDDPVFRFSFLLLLPASFSPEMDCLFSFAFPPPSLSLHAPLSGFFRTILDRPKSVIFITPRS
mmetsp:Transcript_18997/g.47510  ORF Transcript_18997/g.47510 Transcript_18997/m.47510 type:complete len:233 (-) Transcript_18997:2240-2938(-)